MQDGEFGPDAVAICTEAGLPPVTWWGPALGALDHDGDRRKDDDQECEHDEYDHDGKYVLVQIPPPVADVTVFANFPPYW